MTWFDERPRYLAMEHRPRYGVFSHGTTSLIILAVWSQTSLRIMANNNIPIKMQNVLAYSGC